FTDSIDLGSGPLTGSGTNFFLAKINPVTGKALWSTVLGDGSGSLTSVAATPDGGVVVAGSFGPALTLPCMPVSTPSAGAHDIFNGKFDGAGSCKWYHQYGDAMEQYANAVAVDQGGTIYLTGSYAGTFVMAPYTLPQPNGPAAAFVAKFNAMGTCV